MSTAVGIVCGTSPAPRNESAAPSRLTAPIAGWLRAPSIPRWARSAPSSRASISSGRLARSRSGMWANSASTLGLPTTRSMRATSSSVCGR
jgi:hypothetical protein